MKKLLNKHKITILIIVINIIAYIVQRTKFGGVEGFNLIIAGGLFTPYVMDGDWSRLLTALFLHGGNVHLISNLVFIALLGGFFERSVGSWRYLVTYLGGGMIGNLIVCATEAFQNLQLEEYVVTVGASISLFAVLGAMLVLSFRRKGRFADTITWIYGASIVLLLLSGIGVKGVSHVGHIGGTIGGIVIGIFLSYTISDGKFNELIENQKQEK